MSSVKPVIAGVGQTPLGVVPQWGTMQLYGLAAKAAIEDAGLTIDDIDGVLTIDAAAEPYRIHCTAFSEYMGIRSNYSMTCTNGGAAASAMVAHAAAAIRAGLCSNVLVVSADKLATGLGRDEAVAMLADSAGHPQYERPFGASIPAMYALYANRHMHEFGTTPEQLAEVAVLHRRHAALHPDSQMTEPITVDDVISSKLIAEPLHMLDCSLVSDGGAAFVISARSAAADQRRAVDILGSGECHQNEHVSQAPFLDRTTAKESGERAFAAAGITPADVDVALLYDCFTIAVLLQLEDLGFCAKGEAGAFAQSGALELDGSLPLNPHGGLLSNAHPGRPGGMFHVVEAVRQLRGEAHGRQVDGAELAFVHSNGGIMSTHASLVLGRF